MTVLYWSDGRQAWTVSQAGRHIHNLYAADPGPRSYVRGHAKEGLPERRTRQEATFVRYRRPDPVLALILLFLLLVPGILYLYYAGCAERVAIAAYADSQGVPRIVISPRSGKATRDLAEEIQALLLVEQEEAEDGTTIKRTIPWRDKLEGRPDSLSLEPGVR
jgi:hypothetical protein